MIPLSVAQVEGPSGIAFLRFLDDSVREPIGLPLPIVVAVEAVAEKRKRVARVLVDAWRVDDGKTAVAVGVAGPVRRCVAEADDLRRREDMTIVDRCLNVFGGDARKRNRARRYRWADRHYCNVVRFVALVRDADPRNDIRAGVHRRIVRRCPEWDLERSRVLGLVVEAVSAGQYLRGRYCGSRTSSVLEMEETDRSDPGNGAAVVDLCKCSADRGSGLVSLVALNLPAASARAHEACEQERSRGKWQRP